MDSTIISMSTRAATNEDQSKLTQLMDELNGKLDGNTRTTALKNMEDNKAWIATNEAAISAFVHNYLRSIDDIENQLRLPESSIPKYYKLHIDARNVHTGDKSYSGEVEIRVLITQPTNYIIFHSKNQIIDDLKVFAEDGITEVAFNIFSLYPAADTLTIYFDEDLMVDAELVVRINYASTMMNYEAGFYQTSYVIADETRYLGATQFQATEARYAFPHYDEPAYKAVFELKITHNSSVGAISNMMGTDADK